MKRFFFLPLLLLHLLCNAQPGTLDNTFGSGGYTATQIAPSSSSGAHAIAMQSDGKFVTAGVFESDPLSPYSDFAVIRYNKNGSIDNAFGTNGIVTTNFGTSTANSANAVGIQNDGKIIITGSTSGSSSTSGFALIRLNADGSVDNTFGTGGKVVTDFGANHGESEAVIIQPDNKIVVAGDVGLARYNSDGSLDPTFGSGGKVLADYGAQSVALMSDGRIVVAGVKFFSNGQQFALARYNSNGSLDNSFGTGGRVNTVIDNDSELEAIAYSVLIQPDGKIVAAGDVWPDGNTWQRFALGRYNPDGTLDNSFGNQGIVTTEFSQAADAEGHAAVLQNDGKIIVAGNGHGGGSILLARYNADGTLDGSYGTGGLVQNNLGWQASAGGMVLQSDGKIVVSGAKEESSSGNWDFIVARFNSDNATGLADHSVNNNNVTIAPNPSTGIFLIKSGNTQEGTISIYDIMGNYVKRLSDEKSNQYIIDLSDQPKGTYFVELTNSEQKQVRKIVVE